MNSRLVMGRVSIATGISGRWTKRSSASSPHC